MHNKILKRFLSLLLVCLMLTPVISYATSDTEPTEETPDVTEETSEEPLENIDSGIVFEDLAARRQGEAVVAQKQDEINGHKFIAENTRYELYLNEESVSVLIRCKANGAIVETTCDPDEIAYQNQIGRLSAEWEQFVESGLSLQLIRKISQNRFGNASTVNTRLGAKRSATRTYEMLQDGFKVHLEYEYYKISLNLYVYLTDDGFRYEIPADEILDGETVEEPNAETGKMEPVQYYVANIYAFPMLGATMLDIRDGYMVIPDGNGIIVNLDDKQGKYTNAYSSRVYGTAEDDIGQDFTAMNRSELTVNGGRTLNTAVDVEKLSVPVYGFVYTDANLGILTVLEEGEASAKVNASPNGAGNMYWNMMYTQYILRTIYAEKMDATSNAGTNSVMQEQRQTGDIVTSVLLTTGDNASYTGLAIAYRTKLFNEGVFSKDKDTSYRIRLQFLGVDKEDFLVFKRSVKATTIAQVREILGDLIQKGVSDTFVVYDGWQKGGMYSLPIKSFKVDSGVGSKSELVELMQAVERSGNAIFALSDNALDANPDTGSTTFNTIEQINHDVYSRRIYGNVYTSMKALLPEKSAEYLQTLVDQMVDEDLDAIAVSGITDQLFGHLDGDVISNREETAATYHDALAKISEDTYVALDSPFAYLWDTMDAYLNLSVSTSGFTYADEEIAFVSTILKGSVPMYSDFVNFEANKTEFFLKLVETGVYPSFYLTYESPSVLQNTNSDGIYSSQYDYYKEEVVSYYFELKDINDRIGDSMVADYYKTGNVAVTKYDNGLTIYVNYNSNSQNIDGHIVEANSYLVVE